MITGVGHNEPEVTCKVSGEESGRNLSAYEELRREFGQHRGEYVAISHGRLVLYAKDFNVAFNAVKHDPHAIVCEVGDTPRTTPVRVGKIK